MNNDLKKNESKYRHWARFNKGKKKLCSGIWSRVIFFILLERYRRPFSHHYSSIVVFTNKKCKYGLSALVLINSKHTAVLISREKLTHGVSNYVARKCFDWIVTGAWKSQEIQMFSFYPLLAFWLGLVGAVWVHHHPMQRNFRSLKTRLGRKSFTD